MPLTLPCLRLPTSLPPARPTVLALSVPCLIAQAPQPLLFVTRPQTSIQPQIPLLHEDLRPGLAITRRTRGASMERCRPRCRQAALSPPAIAIVTTRAPEVPCRTQLLAPSLRAPTLKPDTMPRWLHMVTILRKGQVRADINLQSQVDSSQCPGHSRPPLRSHLKPQGTLGHPHCP